MKKFNTLLLLFISWAAYGQNHLGISKVITGFKDSVDINQSVSYQVYIKNYGPDVFNGYFNVNTWVDSTSNSSGIFHFSRKDTIVSSATINPGDSLLMNIGDTYDLVTYRTTGNTIVVWPITNESGWSTIDSVFHEVYVRAPVGINEFGINEYDFLIWPNPAIDELFISIDKLKVNIEDVRVLNSLGQYILTVPFEEKINIAELSTGIYLLELNATERKYYKRFIKR